MPYDILVTIFMALDILDLLTGVSHVCSSWRAACFEPTLWWKIDLSRVKPDSVNIPRRPNDVFEDESSNKLLLILKNALKLSHGNVSCLIFHFHVSLRNEHLICAAERYDFSLIPNITNIFDFHKRNPLVRLKSEAKTKNPTFAGAKISKDLSYLHGTN